MSAADLFLELSAAGVTMRIPTDAPDTLELDGPAMILTRDQIERVRRCKVDLLAMLRGFQGAEPVGGECFPPASAARVRTTTATRWHDYRSDRYVTIPRGTIGHLVDLHRWPLLDSERDALGRTLARERRDGHDGAIVWLCGQGRFLDRHLFEPVSAEHEYRSNAERDQGGRDRHGRAGGPKKHRTRPTRREVMRRDARRCEKFSSRELDNAQGWLYTVAMATINDNVIRAIKTCGMSRYALAKTSGVSEGELSRVVAGQRSMTLRTLDRLASHIGVSITIKKARKGKKGR